MSDRPTVNILEYLMKEKLTHWLLVYVSQAVKIRWITKDVEECLACRLSHFLSLLNLLIQM